MQNRIAPNRVTWQVFPVTQNAILAWHFTVFLDGRMVGFNRNCGTRELALKYARDAREYLLSQACN
jgi:hypothetical protein